MARSWRRSASDKDQGDAPVAAEGEDEQVDADGDPGERSGRGPLWPGFGRSADPRSGEDRDEADDEIDLEKAFAAFGDDDEEPDDDAESESISSLLKRIDDVQTGTGRTTAAAAADPTADMSGAEREAFDLLARARDGMSSVDAQGDAQLMALISELNNKLDRTQAAISQSLPATAPETDPAADIPYKVAPEIAEPPKAGRVREMMMFTGMWGALIAAIIAVVYSNSWWLSEPPQDHNRAALTDSGETTRPAALESSAPERLAGSDTADETTPPVDAETTDISQTRSPPRLTAPGAVMPQDGAEAAIATAVAAAGDVEPAAETGSPAPGEPEGATPEDPVTAEDSARPEDDPEGRVSPTVSEWRRTASRPDETDVRAPARRVAPPTPGFFVAPMRGEAGRPIPVAIEVTSVATETEASVMIGGLPEGSKLSAGERAGASTWILSLKDLRGLTLETPAETQSADLELEVTLVTSDGRMPRTKLARLAIAGVKAPEPAAPEPTAVAAVPSAPPEPVTPAPVEDSAPAPGARSDTADAGGELLARGRDLLKIGDIAGARLILELATENGSVEAMVALAKTYDPDYLANLGVRGIRADVAKAIAWYRRASAQGDTQSGDRAQALVAMAKR